MPPTGKPNFADRLRELREGAGLTQAQLAEKAGIHLSAVTRYEHGLREPTLAKAQVLAEALGVPCDAFSQPSAKPAKKPVRGRPKKPAS